MGRPRKLPEHDESSEHSEPSEDETKSGGKTMDLKWSGPDGQVVIGLGSIEHGKTYEIEEKLAKSLLRSSQHWKEG